MHRNTIASNVWMPDGAIIVAVVSAVDYSLFSASQYRCSRGGCLYFACSNRIGCQIVCTHWRAYAEHICAAISPLNMIDCRRFITGASTPKTAYAAIMIVFSTQTLPQPIHNSWMTVSPKLTNNISGRFCHIGKLCLFALQRTQSGRSVWLHAIRSMLQVCNGIVFAHVMPSNI